MAADNINMNSKTNINGSSNPKSSALIVCKSISYPGHKYYFNTLTGESTWNEPTQMQKNKRKFNNSFNTKVEDYPEPSEPPDICKHVFSAYGGSENLLNSNLDPVSYINNVTNDKVVNRIYPFMNLHHCSDPSTQQILNPMSNCIPNMWPVTQPQFILDPGPSRPYHPNNNNTSPNRKSKGGRDFRNLSLQEQPHTQKFMSNLSCCVKGLCKNKNWKSKNRFNNSSDFKNRSFDRSLSGDLRQLLIAKGRCNQNFRLSTSLQNREKEEYQNQKEQDVKCVEKSENNSQKDIDSSDVEWIKLNARDNQLDVMCLRQLAKHDAVPNKWFIVVDTNILLKNKTFLNLILKSDEECILLVPELVMSELRVKFLDSTATVTQARKAVRFVMQNIEVHRAVIDKNEDLSEVMEDISGHIINCCRRLMNNNYFVVLLSDREQIKNKKYANSIHTYTIKEVKEFFVNKHKFNSKSKPEETLVKMAITNDMLLKKATTDTAVQTETICVDQSISAPQMSVLTKQPVPPVSSDDTSKNIDPIQRPPINTPFKIRREINLKRNSNVEPKTTHTPKTNFKWRRRRVLPTQQNLTKDTISNKISNISNNSDNKETNKCTASTSATNLNCEPPNRVQMYANSDDNVESDVSSCVVVNTSSCVKCVIEESTSDAISNTASAAGSEIFDSTLSKNVLSHQNLNVENESSKEIAMFGITSEDMANSLRLRCDEWVFRFVQLMEEALTQTLLMLPPMENPSEPPWTLRDAVECIIFRFSDKQVLEAARIFQRILNNICDSRGAIGFSLEPNDFVTMYSYGVYLVQGLQKLPQFKNIEDLKSAIESLTKLRMEIEEGAYLDERNTSFDKTQHTFSKNISKSNSLLDKLKDNRTFAVENGECHNSQPEGASGNNTIKDKHKKIKITRSFHNDYSFFGSLHLQRSECGGTFVKEYDNSKQVHSVKDPQQSVNKKCSTYSRDSVSNVNPTLSNKVEHDHGNVQKIVRTFQIYEEFERRLQNKNSHLNDEYKSDEDSNDNHSDEYSHYSFEKSSDQYENSQLGVNGVENEHDEASSIINMKLLFAKLILKIKESLLEVHTFCNNAFEELNSSDVGDPKRDLIKAKAEQARDELNELCKSLHSIVTRESNPDLSVGVILKEILNEDTMDDFNEYREVMNKFRHRADILLKSLDLILDAINI